MSESITEEQRDQTHPFQHLVIKAQGLQFTDKGSLISLMERAIEHLKEGKTAGIEHDDDFGFEFHLTRSDVSLFEEHAEQRFE